jgi:hypothetical protein
MKSRRYSLAFELLYGRALPINKGRAMQKILGLVLMSFLFISCGHRKDAKTFEKALEAETGQAHSIAKLWTENGEYVVYKNDVTGEYSAYNLKKWDRKEMTTMSQFLVNAVEGTDIVRNLLQQQEWVEDGYWEDVYESYTEYYEYYDEDCDCYYTDSYTYYEYVGSYWVDTSYWYTFYTGGGFRFDNTSTQTKDLEMVAALKEEVAEKFVAHKLSSEFSLSANRASELAKLTLRYQKLENSRELTDDEKNKFAMDALGVSMAKVENALKSKNEGSDNTYKELLKTASEVNKNNSRTNWKNL